MTSRAQFLARIRAEVRRHPGLFPATPTARPARPRERVQALRRELAERWPQALERFRREFERVAGVFHRVADVREVPQVLAAVAREREVRRVLAWHPRALGTDVGGPLAALGFEVDTMPDVEVAAEERARLRTVAASAELGVTGADLAVAETGTLVVVSGAGRPRSTSLLPACHVAVFDRGALVESLEQVGLALEAWHDGPAPGGRGAAITFITGPSRTADIELTLTRGVHGPREVHAIFVDAGLTPPRDV